jgi:hypothetical protein
VTTIFTAKRAEGGLLIAHILTDQSTSASEMSFFEDMKELKEGVRAQYGETAQLVVPRIFNAELEQRCIHTDETLSLLREYGERIGQDISAYIVYGAPLRPMSAIWARIEHAVYMQVDKQKTGYHTLVAVPETLSPEVIKKYELIFVSRARGEQ